MCLFNSIAYSQSSASWRVFQFPGSDRASCLLLFILLSEQKWRKRHHINQGMSRADTGDGQPAWPRPSFHVVGPSNFHETDRWMGRGRARPVKFSVTASRLGPARQRFQKNCGGPGRPIEFQKLWARSGPARPGPAHQFLTFFYPARPAHDIRSEALETRALYGPT